MYWQFEESVEGLAEACEALATPVVSGNVSFYNESFGNAIFPTPVVGMLGIYDDVSVHIDHAFKDEGDLIFLLGRDDAAIDGSEYQKIHFGKVEGRIPDVDLEFERELQRVVRAAIAEGLVKSAHDCAEGGLAVALAESALASGTTGGARFSDPEVATHQGWRYLGANIQLASTMRADLALFGEGPSRIVVSVAARHAGRFLDLTRHLPVHEIGRVTGGGASGESQPAGTGVTSAVLRITMKENELLAVPVSKLHAAYESLPHRLD
jgi:phosphoribosylformylglycinamidine synthase